jgi:CRP/FNR family cyclic AMP-dependent transcriptional regulator
MTIKTLDRALSEHSIFQGLAPEYLELLSSCARNELFKPGEFVFRHGGNADKFYLIRRGTIALEMATVERGVVTIQTLTKGDVMGFSWLLPPYRHHHDAYVLGWTLALSIDASCLRTKCDADHQLGYALMQRFLPVIADRLKHLELQLMDIYDAQR